MSRRSVLKLAGVLALAGLAPRALAQAGKSHLDLEVDFVPSEPEVVEAMLKLAGVKPGDVVYDLGCGDGRIVITAARQYGATGVGIDIDPERIAEAKENAKKARVGDKVKFRQGDVFEADFHDATVVTLFLRTDYNRKLRPRLLAQLKPGTRIVSHEHDFAEDWPPEKTVRVAGTTVFRWTIPAKK
ncbi:MAG: class I SAM-dependent methyltransferase [Burkholderiales bacterium]|nr:class I SAM-dependent methyltransferase [Burkholderiales bacterium]